MNKIAALLEYAKTNVPFHRRRAPLEYRVLEHWPLMGKEDLVAYSLDVSSDLLSEARERGGYIVASGGTTAKPKYLYYTYEEFLTVSRNVGRCMLRNGLEPGDGVVNYLSAGDMWSSFIMMDKALFGLPVTIYPLGYSPKMDSAAEVFACFKPNVVIGIPSMILNFARYTAEHHPRIRVQKVFYGGEPMPVASKDLLASIWQCELVRSVGYASTDAGSIGWQCPHCQPGEHYAFDDNVVEIVDDEIVTTPLFRKAMPVIRYRTGDRGQWVSPSCDCGQGAPMFKLLGRIDNVLLVWGCRILHDAIVGVLGTLDIGCTAVQVRIQSRDGGQVLLVKFECLRPPQADVAGLLRDRFYEACEDIHGIVSREALDHDLFFESVPADTLERNWRTGKAIPIIDARG